MNKIVNGQVVAMSPEEEAAFLASLPGPQIPQEVTRRQARRALHAAGLLDGIMPAINAMSEPARTAALIDWEDSNTFRRDNVTLAALATALGLNSGQVDDLFIAAAAIT